MFGFFPGVKLMSQFDPINSPFWNLSQTLLWILFRDPKWIRDYQEEPETGFGGEILYGASFKGKNVHSAENELLQALQTGKINATGLQNGLGDPIDIATDTWAYLIFKSIPPRAAPSGAPRKGSSMYSQLQLPSQDIKNIWPTTGGTNTDQEIEQNQHKNIKREEVEIIKSAEVENKIPYINATPLTTLTIDNFDNATHSELPTEPQSGAKKQTPVDNSFTLKGDYWEICFDGQCKSIKNSLGIRYIKYLIQNKGKDIHVSDLYYSETPLPKGATDTALSTVGSQQLEAEGLSISSLGGTGPLMDERGKKEYQAQIKKLHEQIEDAGEFGDTEKVEKLKDEQEQIVNYLSAAFGLGGKPRTSNDPNEQNRKNVSKMINKQKNYLKKHFPKLAEHLAIINTGIFCSYKPKPDINWK
jgi:hypothetical protein